METVFIYWHSLGKLSQSAFAALAALVIYWFIRTVILSRVEKAAAATANDLDDRMVQFRKQCRGRFSLFATVALVLKINSISRSTDKLKRDKPGSVFASASCIGNAD